jgi:hypothetical protein
MSTHVANTMNMRISSAVRMRLSTIKDNRLCNRVAIAVVLRIANRLCAPLVMHC